MKKPFFSIILPNYKTESFLEEALTSVLNQSFSDFECILVNDGSPGITQKEDLKNLKSTDFKRKVSIVYSEKKLQCERIFILTVKNDKRFTLINKENGGQGSARNLAIENANGRFILFLDCDDYFGYDHLSKIKSELDNDKLGWDNTIYYFDEIKEFQIKNNEIITNKGKALAQRCKQIDEHTLLVHKQLGLTFSTISRSLISNYRFNFITKTMEDFEIIIRMLALSETKILFKEISVDTIWHRRHNGSITYSDLINGSNKELTELIIVYKNYLKLKKNISFREKLLANLAIKRFELQKNKFRINLYYSKVYGLIAKIVSGWFYKNI